MKREFKPADLPRWQRPLVAGAWLSFALLLLTPLVVTFETAYPFALGKAVYARTLVAIGVVLWVPLALANERFRPPRSWLLVLWGAALAIALLASATGVNLERSLWSTYDRVHGVVDSAHWLALAVVLVSIVQGGRQWRALLTLNLTVSAVVALVAISRFHGFDLPYLRDSSEITWRVSASLGSSAYLGHYALLNGLVGGGLAARLLADRPWSRGATSRAWPCVLYALAALLNFWAMALSGALGAYVALIPAAGALALAYAVFGHEKAGRRIGAGALAVVGVAGASLGFLFFVDNPLKVRAQNNPVVQRLAFASIEGRTTQTRLAAWRAGIEGIAERPLLGWGPENFIVPFGEFGTGVATTTNPHDRAHNEFIEEATAKGLLGVAAYIAIWVLTFVVVVRYIRIRQGPRAPPESRHGQALAMFIGAALVADFLLKQTLFAHTAGLLLYTLLLGFVIGLEDEMRREGTGPAMPRPVARVVERWLATAWPRVLIVPLTLGLAGAATYSSIAIYAGGKALVQFAHPRATLADLDRAIEAFPPLANSARRLFLDDLAKNWKRLRLSQSREAARLLARADIEAAAAENAEPNNWLVIHSIARLYRTVAATDPEYEDKAERYEGRALELAPNMAIAPPRP
ncbi:MAG: O-antigen ligase family protein [Gammaproteobacteria bacterium]|nr:O-antigen ligase family protein [Gammaproteobacteria bacterium]